MPYSVLIPVIALIHFGFVLFVITGGVLAFRWPRLIWWHLSCACYGVLIMIVGWQCPLSDVEAWLRRQRGESVVPGEWAFLDHYVWPLVGVQGTEWFITVALVVAIVVFNFRAYRAVWFRS
ncbi:DUF2784 domain-containing protein [Porticoccus sp.]